MKLVSVSPAKLGLLTPADILQNIQDPYFLRDRGYLPLGRDERIAISKLVETSERGWLYVVIWSQKGDGNADFYLRKWERGINVFCPYIETEAEIDMTQPVILGQA